MNKVDDIEVIYSHPHAINESKETLSKHNLSNFVPVESTSTAALYASKQKYSAAICSEYAAKLYNLKIILKDINDSINITRFVVISNKIHDKGNKTMIMFTVPHKPGSLYKVLEKFYYNNINLTMIYSRPLKSIPWQYYFYLEFEGELRNEKVKETIDSIKELVNLLKIKGTFTRLQYQALSYQD